MRAFKPVVTGWGSEPLATSDPGVLLDAMGRTPTAAEIEWIAPVRFAAPLAPAQAARREGSTVEVAALLDLCAAARNGAEDILLIEGVGGVMVPLAGRQTVLDWMGALEMPVILVAGSYLGTLSHTLSALEVLRTRMLSCVAIVISETPQSSVSLSDTVSQLREQVVDCPVIALPRASDWRAAAALATHIMPPKNPNRG